MAEADNNKKTTVVNNADTTADKAADANETVSPTETSTDGRKSLTEQGVPPEFKIGLSKLNNNANNASRQNEKLIINDRGYKESIRLGNHRISMAPSPMTNLKVENSKINSQTMQENHIANTVSFTTDEFVMNGHKMNPNIWEYSDFKNYKDMYLGEHTVGNLCMLGTVLTVAFDYQLKKYVLIRRLARMPFFAPKQNVQEILPELNIEDPSKVVNEYGVKQHTISADDWYNKYGKAIEQEKKNAKDKKDEADKKEAAEKDKKQLDNDVKYLMSHNSEMTREQAIEVLKKDPKYKDKKIDEIEKGGNTNENSNKANGNSPTKKLPTV